MLISRIILMVATLVHHSGDPKIQLSSYPFIIGSDPGQPPACRLHDPQGPCFLSKRHAVFTLNNENQLCVEDQNTKNGTFLNGARLTSKSVLQDGDVLSFSEHQIFRFVVSTAKLEAPDLSASLRKWLEFAIENKRRFCRITRPWSDEEKARFSGNFPHAALPDLRILYCKCVGLTEANITVWSERLLQIVAGNVLPHKEDSVEQIRQDLLKIIRPDL